MKTTMTERLKTALGEEKPKVEQRAPVVDDYQITHSLPQDDLEPDADAVPNILFSDNFDSDDPIVPSEEHQTEEQLIDELLDTATVELNLANFISAIKKSFETSRCEIEEKNAIIHDLLVKNAELAGFIDGIKFIRGWLAG